MLKHRSRYTFVLVAVAIGVLVAAQPAWAYKEVRQSGTVGMHSLTDTSSSPGADCIYRYRSGWGLWQLKRINVDAPNVRAVPSQGDEQVGWRFTVQRRAFSAFSNHPGPWEHRYTSEVFKAVTDSTHDAAFSPAAVRVNVPVEPGSDVVFIYRAVVKAYWYRANGSVLGTATMRVGWYNSVKGSGSETQHRACSDYLI
jgi:hypothetical protein